MEAGKLSVEFLEAFNNAMSLVNVKIKMYQLWSNKNVPFIRLFHKKISVAKCSYEWDTWIFGKL